MAKKRVAGSEYRRKKGLKAVLASAAGEAFVAAVKAELKGSDKIEPLEITLKESAEDDVAADADSILEFK